MHNSNQQILGLQGNPSYSDIQAHGGTCCFPEFWAPRALSGRTELASRHLEAPAVSKHCPEQYLHQRCVAL